MREKFTNRDITSEVSIQESRIISFDRKDNVCYSFRVYRDGVVGIHYQEGDMSDEEGFARAEKNLALNRPYPYDLETGVRHRDKTELQLKDGDILDFAREIMDVVRTRYPRFSFSGSFGQYISIIAAENSKGMDYSNRDCHTTLTLMYKHADSKNIDDGGFDISLRSYDKEKVFELIDNNLANYENVLEIPDDIIIMNQYYGYLGLIKESLNAESLALGTSLFTGKIGERVFSPEFSLIHDVSDENCWDNTFFDGEGVVLEGDRLPYIENGVILRGYADKRIAEKYNVPCTGSAWRNFSDIPSNGKVNLTIKRSAKTVKELLDGRLCIIPVYAAGGGFNEKGDYVTPVQMSFLCDGEKILGRLPEFTLATNMYEMFGDGFIGVGSDQPVFNDKSILFRAHRGK